MRGCVIIHICVQKFKRLRKIQDEESDNEEGGDDTQDRDAIAAEIFSDEVSELCHLIKHVSVWFCVDINEL